MEIEKGNIGNGEFYIAFGVNNGNDRLAIAEYKSQLRFAIRTESDNRTFTFLSREQIQALLPYLQSFAGTGELEPQQSPLQGGIEQLTRELLKASKLVENGFVSDEEVEAYSDACTHFIREARKLLGE